MRQEPSSVHSDNVTVHNILFLKKIYFIFIDVLEVW